MTKKDAWHLRLCCSWVLGLGLTLWAGSASAKWYMVVGTLPNNVEVVDTSTDKVVKTIALEGQGPVLAIATNPAAPRYAYATTNLDQAVAVVDLEQGKQVATYKLSNDTEIVRVEATNLNPKGERIYAFCIGQDILVLDSEDGHRLGTIPLAHRNITGIRATYGLPILANYQEQNYLITFAIIVEDSITDTDTLS